MLGIRVKGEQYHINIMLKQGVSGIKQQFSFWVRADSRQAAHCHAVADMGKSAAGSQSRLQADFDYRPANSFEGCPKHVLPMPGQRGGMRQNDFASRLPQRLTRQ